MVWKLEKAKKAVLKDKYRNVYYQLIREEREGETQRERKRVQVSKWHRPKADSVSEHAKAGWKRRRTKTKVAKDRVIIYGLAMSSSIIKIVLYWNLYLLGVVCLAKYLGGQNYIFFSWKDNIFLKTHWYLFFFLLIQKS